MCDFIALKIVPRIVLIECTVQGRLGLLLLIRNNGNSIFPEQSSRGQIYCSSLTALHLHRSPQHPDILSSYYICNQFNCIHVNTNTIFRIIQVHMNESMNDLSNRLSCSSQLEVFSTSGDSMSGECTHSIVLQKPQIPHDCLDSDYSARYSRNSRWGSRVPLPV